jgi:hypothetical protein
MPKKGEEGERGFLPSPEKFPQPTDRQNASPVMKKQSQ